MRKFTEEDVVIKDVTRSFNGFFKVDQYTLSHRLFSEKMSEVFTREVFERGDAVVLLPYDPKADSVVLQVQFRAGAIKDPKSAWLLECVAGMFGEKESPIDVAIREAQEEANLDIAPQHVEHIMNYYSSPGGTSEKIHLYIGKVNSAEAGGVFGLEEENEDIFVKTYTRKQAIACLAEGKITNAATIIALQWLEMNYAKLQNKWLKP